MRFQHTLDVAAPPERVFAAYADVARWPEWTDSVSSVELIDPGPLAVGSRARVRQPKLPAAVWVVTEMFPDRAFTWVAQGPGLRSTGTHAVEALPDGGSRVTAILDQSGLLGGVVGRLTKGLTESYLEMELRGLQQRCEQPA